MKFNQSIILLLGVFLFDVEGVRTSEGQQTFSSLRNRIRSESRQPGTMPNREERQRMLEIINEAFEGVPMVGGEYLENAGTQKIPSWTSCSKIDFSAFCLNEENSLLCSKATSSSATEEAMASLNLEKCLPGGEYAKNPTCQAVWATIAAYSKLSQEMPAGPAFANYNAVEWTSKTVANTTFPKPDEWGPYPSWIPGGFDPETKTWIGLGNKWGTVGGNSAAGWSVCDVVFNVLKQNNNQVGGGTCGPTAVLAAVSRREPSYAMRLMVELIWTGTLEILDAEPCDVILNQFPGLVPIPDPSIIDCSDASKFPNPQDCRNSLGQPFNAVGTQQIFVSSMLSASIRHVNYPYYSDTCAVEQGDIQLATANNADDWGKIKSAQGTVPSQIEWMANSVRRGLDGKEMMFHIGDPSICDGLGIDDRMCSLLTSQPGLDGIDADILSKLTAANVKVVNGSLAVDWQSVYDSIQKANNPKLDSLLRWLNNLSKETGRSLFDFSNVMLKAIGAPFAVLNTEVEIIKEACRSNVAIVNIASGNLNYFKASNQPTIQQYDNGQYSVGELLSIFGIQASELKCDHWVFIESCPDDLDAIDGKIDIWTWGESGYKMSKKVLASMTCGIIY